MIHISMIVWVLCMLQSVSAFAPAPEPNNPLAVTPQFIGFGEEPSVADYPELTFDNPGLIGGPAQS